MTKINSAQKPIAMVNKITIIYKGDNSEETADNDRFHTEETDHFEKKKDCLSRCE